MTIPNNLYQNLPFMSGIKTNSIECVGIIINTDKNVLSIYDFAAIKTEEERVQFLSLGEVWWWESNRKIPISIFLKQDMIPFRYVIKTYNSKDIELLFGPIVNLSEMSERRLKRKSITLVKNLKAVKPT